MLERKSKMATKSETKETIKVESKYTREQLLKSKKFSNRKDVLNIVVKDSEELSISEVETRIDTFMKGKVS